MSEEFSVSLIWSEVGRIVSEEFSVSLIWSEVGTMEF